MGELVTWLEGREKVRRVRAARLGALEAENRLWRARIRESKAKTRACERELERLKWGDPGPGAA